ncbi:MAG TPA: cysteine peptidase family C39 domain-containing protein [Polyangia bacterium]|jgi:ABC-type bacteriocin/lantibiotic exporter with double-glycine peptidase domain|nr:cysteine peptidase family C39 domain-containing protein [Polyangia bacterium]
MRAAFRLALIVLLAPACYAGSARSVSAERASALAADPAWTFARDVPFVRQQSDADCGPAALAMVLQHFGLRTTLAELVAREPPRDGGVRAGDLRDVAREKGLAAFVVAGTFGDLSEQLARGRPVLVGLATPMTGGRALAHYEVVVAIDRRDGRLLTLDPGRGLREDSLAGFAREWAPTGRVTLIVFRPESADGRAS